MLIDPVPAGIILRPGAAVALSACIACFPITLRVPAAGHIYSDACNHKRMRPGAVLRASKAGDIAALETALAAGGSTEKADWVRRGRCPFLIFSTSLLLFNALIHHSHCTVNNTSLIYAARYDHTEAVRMLLAAGADANSKDQVGCRRT